SVRFNGDIQALNAYKKLLRHHDIVPFLYALDDVFASQKLYELAPIDFRKYFVVYQSWTSFDSLVSSSDQLLYFQNGYRYPGCISTAFRGCFGSYLHRNGNESGSVAIRLILTFRF